MAKVSMKHLLEKLEISDLYLKYIIDLTGINDYYEFHDGHSEHLRHKILTDYICRKRKFDSKEFEVLLQILSTEADKTMALSVCKDLIKTSKLDDKQWYDLLGLMTKLGEKQFNIDLICLEKKIKQNDFFEDDMIDLLSKSDKYDFFAKNVFPNSKKVMEALLVSKFKKVRNFAIHRMKQLDGGAH